MSLSNFVYARFLFLGTFDLTLRWLLFIFPNDDSEIEKVNNSSRKSLVWGKAENISKEKSKSEFQ